ncbi:hypothetical protein EAI_04307 [Harpegnathos saltator]|uniref:Uncharacterized protein n=1 Tax=Harpegnathos saltator TaxID=610380 RepID=E2BZQ5_HARSA|nr:hypothetical protein EAI_04307 [Harpegnathos saltator]
MDISCRGEPPKSGTRRGCGARASLRVDNAPSRRPPTPIRIGDPDSGIPKRHTSEQFGSSESFYGHRRLNLEQEISYEREAEKI